MNSLTKSLVCLFIAAVSSVFGAGIHVVDDLTKEATAKPGDKVQGAILVQNSGDKPGEVKVYQTDYLFFSGGKNDYGEPGSVQRSNSSWIAFTPSQFVIQPGETAKIYYTIEVPNDESLCGTYWSMLMVEPIADGALKPIGSSPDKINLGIHTVMRYAIQVVVNIGDTGKREIKIANKQIITKDGDRFLQLDIENVGERWLRPWIRAEIYDDQGARIGSFGGSRTRIFPGCSVRIPIKITDLQAGKYTSLVVVDNGDDSVWGAQYEMDIK